MALNQTIILTVTAFQLKQNAVINVEKKIWIVLSAVKKVMKKEGMLINK
jgi:hypothetical protein